MTSNDERGVGRFGSGYVERPIRNKPVRGTKKKRSPSIPPYEKGRVFPVSTEVSNNIVNNEIPSGERDEFHSLAQHSRSSSVEAGKEVDQGILNANSFEELNDRINVLFNDEERRRMNNTLTEIVLARNGDYGRVNVSNVSGELGIRAKFEELLENVYPSASETKREKKKAIKRLRDTQERFKKFFLDIKNQPEGLKSTTEFISAKEYFEKLRDMQNEALNSLSLDKIDSMEKEMSRLYRELRKKTEEIETKNPIDHKRSAESDEGLAGNLLDAKNNVVKQDEVEIAKSNDKEVLKSYLSIVNDNEEGKIIFLNDILRFSSGRITEETLAEINRDASSEVYKNLDRLFKDWKKSIVTALENRIEELERTEGKNTTNGGGEFVLPNEKIDDNLKKENDKTYEMTEIESLQGKRINYSNFKIEDFVDLFSIDRKHLETDRQEIEQKFKEYKKSILETIEAKIDELNGVKGAGAPTMNTTMGDSGNDSVLENGGFSIELTKKIAKKLEEENQKSNGFTDPEDLSIRRNYFVKKYKIVNFISDLGISDDNAKKYKKDIEAEFKDFNEKVIAFIDDKLRELKGEQYRGGRNPEENTESRSRAGLFKNDYAKVEDGQVANKLKAEIDKIRSQRDGVQAQINEINERPWYRRFFSGKRTLEQDLAVYNNRIKKLESRLRKIGKVSEKATELGAIGELNKKRTEHYGRIGLIKNEIDKLKDKKYNTTDFIELRKIDDQIRALIYLWLNSIERQVSREKMKSLR